MTSVWTDTHERGWTCQTNLSTSTSIQSNRGRDGDGSLEFSCVYFVAETDEGLRIIYHYAYSSTHGGWWHPCLLEHLQVHAPGRLMEIHRLTPPSDSQANLEEYHSDTMGLTLVQVE